mmetsp:Transcript_31595/g.101010  ORF Transcript_31595/g.101010 Transcript_31595/m.101010 type:complete len:227 (-) Transcript_31595:333-1013(-)
MVAPLLPAAGGGEAEPAAHAAGGGAARAAERAEQAGQQRVVVWHEQRRDAIVFAVAVPLQHHTRRRGGVGRLGHHPHAVLALRRRDLAHGVWLEHLQQHLGHAARAEERVRAEPPVVCPDVVPPRPPKAQLQPDEDAGDADAAKDGREQVRPHLARRRDDGRHAASKDCDFDRLDPVEGGRRVRVMDVGGEESAEGLALRGREAEALRRPLHLEPLLLRLEDKVAD